jgi:hypothetical protein
MFSFFRNKKRSAGGLIRKFQKRIIRTEDNEIRSVRSYIRGFKEKMFLEEIAVRKLKNWDNPDSFEIRTKLNTVTKYEAIKKTYQTILK